jgi:hypothetical protein
MSQATLVIQETPLDGIRLHPRNLRRRVGDVAEMEQSMKERGVLEPLIVAPGLDEEAGVVHIVGHRPTGAREVLLRRRRPAGRARAAAPADPGAGRSPSHRDLRRRGYRLPGQAFRRRNCSSSTVTPSTCAIATAAAAEGMLTPRS